MGLERVHHVVTRCSFDTVRALGKVAAVRGLVCRHESSGLRSYLVRSLYMNGAGILAAVTEGAADSIILLLHR